MGNLFVFIYAYSMFYLYEIIFQTEWKSVTGKKVAEFTTKSLYYILRT